MSISFKRNNNSDSLLCKIHDLVENLDSISSRQAIIEHFLKLFDIHYLNYINYRKQRDLIILNCFYQIICKHVKVAENLKKKFGLSDVFESKDGYLQINNDVILLDVKENIVSLEREIEILKTFMLFFEDFLNKDNDNIYIDNLSKKINKVKFLDDNNFVKRITNNVEIKKQILLKIGEVKDFNKISTNYIFYNGLKKECELYGFSK